MGSLLAEQEELKRRLQNIERRVAEGFKEHENELREIRFAISQLEINQETKKQRIGFDPGAGDNQDRAACHESVTSSV
jgi:hypothetical protein